MVGLIFLASVALSVDATPTEKAKPEVAAQIRRLNDPAQHPAAVATLTRYGRTAVSELVAALGDANDEVRVGAAEALRNVLAADPEAAPNRHEKKYWEERLKKVTVGTPLKEALEALFPDMTEGERGKLQGPSLWSGGGGSSTYRLDDYWSVTLYLVDFEHRRVNSDPVLAGTLKYVWVNAPGDFTGTWHAFFVNGQPSHVIEYRGGKYHGTFTTFNAEGKRNMEQHYVDGVAHGLDTGFHADGTPSYQGTYDHGKQVGTWRWFDEKGNVTSTQTFPEVGK